jgi:AcrR family transcriptional regulator
MGVYERQQKEKKILESAILLFGEKGFHTTKVEDVAKTAKISKGLVYFYFKSKEDLYMAIAKKGTEELKDVFNKAFGKEKDKTGLEVMADLVNGYLQFTEDKKVFHDAILYFLSVLELYQKDSTKVSPLITESQFFNKLLQSHNDLAKIGIKAISLGIKDESMRPDLQADSTFYTIWTMLIGYCHLSGSINLEPNDIKINTESWKNGFYKILFEILKGTNSPLKTQPFQGNLF